MSNFEHTRDRAGKTSRKPASRPLREISITGSWWVTDDELIDRVDGALHDAGLCACNQPHQFYTFTVKAVPEEVFDNRG